MSASERAATHRDLRGVVAPGLAFGPFGPRAATVLALDLWETWSELRVLEQDPTSGWLDRPDPRDGWILWDAVDDTGTRYWGFPSTSGGSDTWLITTIDLVPAVPPGARRLRLRASYAGVTSEGAVDLAAVRPPGPAPGVTVRATPPAHGGSRCRWCAAAPAESAGLCGSCRTIQTTTAERRDRDVHAERTLTPLAVQAGHVLGGPLTVLGIETMPHGFVVRLHHDVDWAPADDTCGADPGNGWDTGHPTTWGRWELTDDCGARYTGCNLSSHAGRGGWWGELHFHPRLDPRARGLELHLVAAGRDLARIAIRLVPPDA